MMPALGRGVQILYVGMNFADWPNIDIMIPLYATQLIIMSMLGLGAWKFGTLRHPATYLALAVNVFVFLLEPLGRSDSVQTILKTMIKG